MTPLTCKQQIQAELDRIDAEAEEKRRAVIAKGDMLEVAHQLCEQVNLPGGKFHVSPEIRWCHDACYIWIPAHGYGVDVLRRLDDLGVEWYATCDNGTVRANIPDIPGVPILFKEHEHRAYMLQFYGAKRGLERSWP
jgi:hypothetical protein